MVIALVSAKGSPGVTTAALALTLTWPGRCVLAECDPAGGSIQAGYLAGALPADRGVRELAVAVLRGEELGRAWWGQLVDLQHPHRRRLLLPGVTDPVQSGALRPVWPELGGFFTTLEHAEPGFDVIVDGGRLAAPNPPLPVLARADVVLLVITATLPGIAAAVPAVRSLRTELAGAGSGTGALGLLLTGHADQPARAASEQLRVPVAASFPYDRRTAHKLARGGGVRLSAPLMRAAALTGRRIGEQIGRRRRATKAGEKAEVVTYGG